MRHGFDGATVLGGGASWPALTGTAELSVAAASKAAAEEADAASRRSRAAKRTWPPR
jgi:hypothetical protein